MQVQQDKKELFEDRFSNIDKKWTVVEDAFRIQAHERTQDISTLKDNLQQRMNQVNSLQTQKGQMTTQVIQNLQAQASETKENLEKLLEREASFRVDHLDTKNQWIQNHLNNGGAFNASLQQYATNKIGDMCSRLQAIDAANRLKTQQTLKELKEEIIGQAKLNFAKEKEKYVQILNKITGDTNRQLDQLRDLMKASRKQREQGEGKLKIMISSLVQELSKLSDEEAREGEMTYDCLLKLLEECCGKIQEAQLR